MSASSSCQNRVERTLLLAAIAFSSAVQTTLAAALPSSSPTNYPGKPKGDFSPEWQSYFQVKDPLPNVTFPLSRSFAGNIPTSRSDHPNDTLFFWGFENSDGSLTAKADERKDEPWAIWLNGGPGSSSMVGMLFENGPLRVNPDYSISANEHSWHKVVDYIWVDQPVGVGYGTADAKGYVADEDEMATDFIGFLTNLVKVFPSLATRPLHLTGESYAGMYIPYIMKHYTSMSNPPVKIVKIAIGDGSIGTWQAFNLLPAVSVLRTFPQIIGYDESIFQWFQQQERLCGYDINLTYPSTEALPNLALVEPRDRSLMQLLKARKLRTTSASTLMMKRQLGIPGEVLPTREAEVELLYKREKPKAVSNAVSNSQFFSQRASGVVDPWYGCFLFDAFLDYAFNFTTPWNANPDAPPPTGSFDIYNVPDAFYPSAFMDASVFMNDKRTRKALHAPTDKDWVDSFPYVFGDIDVDPSVEPIAFLSDLATQLTSKNIGVVLYSGNNDALIPHRGTEVTIQNTTFGGIRGFTRKPSTPFTDDNGQFVGIVHQERGWTYALFEDAGHLLPAQKPAAALAFLREFIIGSNETGTVRSDGSVVGGEDHTFDSGIIQGRPEIYVGPGTTSSTYMYPEATRAAWDEFIAKELSVSGASNGASKSGVVNTALTLVSGMLLGVVMVLGI